MLFRSPLHLASQFDHMEIVDFLIKKGADPTIKNSSRVTAAELGAKLRIGDNSEEAEKETPEGPAVGSEVPEVVTRALAQSRRGIVEGAKAGVRLRLEESA